MLKKIEVDTHTHTVLSGHAWSTLRENASAGRAAGLAGLCLTEHGYGLSPASIPSFLTYTCVRLLPPEVEGIRIFRGVEANITNARGEVDIEAPLLFMSEWTIASIHSECMVGNREECTSAYTGALRHPAVDMLGHIDDLRSDNDFAAVIAVAAEEGKVIELNNNSLSMRRGSVPRVEEIMRLCKKAGVRIAVSSDAHFDAMVGRVAPGLELLDRVGFPDELVMNRTMESFLGYVEERRARMEKAKPKKLPAE